MVRPLPGGESANDVSIVVVVVVVVVVELLAENLFQKMLPLLWLHACTSRLPCN